MSRFTVSELTRELGHVLAESFGEFAVEGEVSGFKAHTSGHWYFSLKDEGAVLGCAMFRGDNLKMRRQPREGERVVLHGALSVYAPRGTYSMIARRIEAVGTGDLLRRLEELRLRLAQEGLFDTRRKRRLPSLPRALGVVTSPTGAALQDVLRVVRQRHPGMPVYLAPCRVQGEGSVAEIVAALRLLVAHGRCDVAIVGRGGGSAEDLWSFNAEEVVRAVAACPIPVVSAVGHEVDVTLCDLAADVRAATPSHAAELCVPVAAELIAAVEAVNDRLMLAMERRLAAARERVARLRLVHPRERILRGRERARVLDDRLQRSMARALERRKSVLATRAARLDALSPLRVLQRGYSLATQEGAVVTDAAALTVGTPLRVRFARGAVVTRVELVEP